MSQVSTAIPTVSDHVNETVTSNKDNQARQLQNAVKVAQQEVQSKLNSSNNQTIAQPASTNDKPVMDQDEFIENMTDNRSWTLTHWNSSGHHQDSPIRYYLDDTTMSPFQMDQARSAFEKWNEVIAVDIVETTDPNLADLTFLHGETEGDVAGYAQGSLGHNNSKIVIRDTYSDGYFEEGDNGYKLYLHEIGHAIGISHPGDYNGEGATYNDNALSLQDSQQYSLMSYFSEKETEAWFRSESSSPMLYDVLAAQEIWGANESANLGDNIYYTGGTRIGEGNIYTIYDRGGEDTINSLFENGRTGYHRGDTIEVLGVEKERDHNGYGYFFANEINMEVGEFSSTDGMRNNISIAPGSVIENAYGGRGNDRISANGANNKLSGNGGDDIIFAKSGADTISDSAGSDRYYLGSLEDNRAALPENSRVSSSRSLAPRPILTNPDGDYDLHSDEVIFYYSFESNSGGDSIHQFDPKRDKITIKHAPDDVAARLWETSNGSVLVDFGSGTIEIMDVKLADINETNFQGMTLEKLGTPPRVSSPTHNGMNIDLNGNGIIDWEGGNTEGEEFSILYEKLFGDFVEIRPNDVYRLHDIFDAVDLNNDGTITGTEINRVELKVALERMNEQLKRDREQRVAEQAAKEAVEQSLKQIEERASAQIQEPLFQNEDVSTNNIDKVSQLADMFTGVSTWFENSDNNVNDEKQPEESNANLGWMSDWAWSGR